MASNDNSPLKPILIIGLLLSLALNAYLFIAKNKKSDEVKVLSARVDSLGTATSTLAKSNTETTEKLAATETNLEDFRGKNAQLDSMLDVANKEIVRRKAKIKVLEKD